MSGSGHTRARSCSIVNWRRSLPPLRRASVQGSPACCATTSFPNRSSYFSTLNVPGKYSGQGHVRPRPTKTATRVDTAPLWAAVGSGSRRPGWTSSRTGGGECCSVRLPLPRAESQSIDTAGNPAVRSENSECADAGFVRLRLRPPSPGSVRCRLIHPRARIRFQRVPGEVAGRQRGSPAAGGRSSRMVPFSHRNARIRAPLPISL